LGALSSLSQQIKDTPVHFVAISPLHPENLIVCIQSPVIYITTMKGQVNSGISKLDSSYCYLQIVRNLSSDKGGGVGSSDFICCTLSPKGEWLYAITEDGTLHAFNLKGWTLEHTMKVQEKEPLGVAHHPHLNLLATYAADGKLNLWKSTS
jgi:WD40 repeat-containing protein SMU1